MSNKELKYENRNKNDNLKRGLNVADYESLGVLVGIVGNDEVDLYVSTGTHVVDSDLTIPSNINLVFEIGGKLYRTNNADITLNCGIDAGLWQILDDDGTGSWLGNPKISEVYPEWFGAIADGSTDSGAYIQSAEDFCHDVCPLIFANGEYRTSIKLTRATGSKWLGKGSGASSGTILQYTSIKRTANVVLMEIVGDSLLVSPSTRLRNIETKGIMLNGNNTSADIVSVQAGSYYRFEDVYVYKGAGRGWFIKELFDSTFTNCRMDECGSDTLHAMDIVSGDSFEESNEIKFNECIFEGCEKVLKLSSDSGESQFTNEIYFNNCKFENLSTDEEQILLDEVLHCAFTECNFEMNGTTGNTIAQYMKIKNSTNVRISGTMGQNSRTGTADYTNYINVENSNETVIDLSFGANATYVVDSAVITFDATSNGFRQKVMSFIEGSNANNKTVHDLSYDFTSKNLIAKSRSESAVTVQRDGFTNHASWQFGRIVGDGDGGRCKILRVEANGDTVDLMSFSQDDFIRALKGVIIKGGLYMDIEQPSYTGDGTTACIWIDSSGYIKYTDGTQARGVSTRRTGASNPTGSITPLMVGEIYINTTNDVGYLSVGLTNADWKQITV